MAGITKLIDRAAAKEDATELVRLTWGFGQSDNAAEIDRALRDVARRLAAQSEVEELTAMLGLPESPGRQSSHVPGVEELISLGSPVRDPVLAAARRGGYVTKARAAFILEAVGEREAAALVRQWLEHEVRLPGYLPAPAPLSFREEMRQLCEDARRNVEPALGIIGGLLAYGGALHTHSQSHAGVVYPAVVFGILGTSAGRKRVILPTSRRRTRFVSWAASMVSGLGCCVLGAVLLAVSRWHDTAYGVVLLVGGLLVLTAGSLRMARHIRERR